MEPITSGASAIININITQTIEQPSSKLPSFRQILAEKTFLLRTGTYDNVIKKEGKIYECRICDCILEVKEIKEHVAGKNHIEILQDCRMFERYKDNRESLPLDSIRTKEPHPPGMAVKNSTTNTRKSPNRSETRPLIGLEYILEIVHEKPIPSIFLCTLCHKKGNTRMALLHTAGFYHISEYIRKHFPRAFRRFGFEIETKKKGVHKSILVKIARAIEETYGRLKPTQVEAQKFSSNKIHYFKALQEGYHFSENSGETFESIVLEELPRKTFLKTNLRKGGLKDWERGGSYGHRKTDSNDNLNKFEVFHKSTEDIDVKFPRENRKKDDYLNKLEVFYKLANDIDDEMEKLLQKHRENPEEHPQYNDEWKKFWKGRYTDLQARGKDTSKYNFKIEWQAFWSKRILELYHEESKSKKMVLRRMLNLKEEHTPVRSFTSPRRNQKRGPIDAFYSGNSPRRRTRSRSPLRYRDTPPGRTEIRHEEFSHRRSSPPRSRESLSCNRESLPRFGQSPLRRSSSISRFRGSSSHRRDSLPRFRESSLGRYPSTDYRAEPPCLDYVPPFSSRFSPPDHLESSVRNRRSHLHCDDERYPERREREMSVERSRSREKSTEIIRQRERLQHRYSHDKVESASYVETDLVELLRLLKDLEECLGSLGPNLMKLLSDALSMEKKRTYSSRELLDKEANCVLLEAVRIKLNRQLQTGSVKGAQEKVLRTAIEDIKTVTHMAYRRKKQRKGSKYTNVLSGVDYVDKEKISRKIVDTLMSQGRKDITQEELNQMIEILIKKDRSQSPSTISRSTKSKGVQDDKEGKQASMLVDIDSDDEFWFDDVPYVAPEKEKEDHMLGRAIKNVAHTNQSSNRNINIISSVPASSITINEFSFGGTFGNTQDFHKQNQQRSTESSQNMRFHPENSLLSLPASTKPYNVTNSGSVHMPGFGPDVDTKWSVGSGLLVKPSGFPDENNVSSNYQCKFSPPDSKQTFPNMGGASFSNMTNQSMLFSDESMLRGGSFSSQPMSWRSNQEWRGGQSGFISERGGVHRPEMTEPGSGAVDLLDGSSNHRVEQSFNREKFSNFRINDGKGMPPRFRSTSNVMGPQVDYRGGFRN